MDIPDVLKHYLAIDGNQFSVHFNWDTLNDHVLSHDSVGEVNLRNLGFSNDVHPCIFDHLGAIFTDGFLWIDSKEIAISFTKEDDLPIRIGNHYAIVDIVENGLVESDFFLKFIEGFSFHLYSPEDVRIIYHNRWICQTFREEIERGLR